MRSLVLGAGVALALTLLPACDENQQEKPRAATSPTASTDCGRADYRRTPDFEQTPEIACMRRALLSHRPARVLLIQQSTDSGPLPNTYDLDSRGQVALTIDVSDDPYRGSGPDLQRSACVKPTWLPGATCPAPDPMSRPAPFTVAPGQEVTARTRYVEVLVRPTHCTAERTGSVLAPTVERTSGQVRVLFRVSNRPRHVGHCDGVGIPYRVDLRAPLGDRWIVDSSCIMPTVYWRDVCTKTKIRARAN